MKSLNCLYSDVPAEETEQDLQQASKSTGAALPGWLTSETLPAADRARKLLDIYFTEIHSVRSLGFIHVPTFMERYRNHDALLSDRSGLILIMCALAAPFLYARTLASQGLGAKSARFYDAGRGWAASAMQCMFSNFGSPAVECLMVAVLLHEHHLRTGDHAKAMLLSGIVARHVQILQLNVEHDTDVLCELDGSLPWTVRESRRRLFWACYLQDALIECGIDQLRLISTEDVQIQLPCLEDLFIREKPCVTEMLRPSTLLPFIDPTRSFHAVEHMDMRAFYVRAMAIRSSALKYVKHLDDDVPWDANGNSRFQTLEQELNTLEASIPDVLEMASGNTYLYKSSGRLNTYFGFHILLAQTMNDLYRVGVSGLVFPSSATKWIRENAPADFIQRCHQKCAKNGVRIAMLLEELYGHQKDSMIDVPYAMHAQVCSGVIVSTLASWKKKEAVLPDASLDDYRSLLRSNVKVLQHLQRYMKVEMFLESATQALKRFDRMVADQSLSRAELRESNHHVMNPSHFSLDHILNPLGVYPIARTQARDRHKPERFEHLHVAGAGLGTGVLTSLEPFGPEMMIAEDQFQGNAMWDWGLQIPLLEGLGYPTFLEDCILVPQAMDNEGQPEQLGF